MRNLHEALTGVVERHYTRVREAARDVAAALENAEASTGFAEPETSVDVAEARRSRSVELSQLRRAHRLARYEQVVKLRQQGISLRAIARCLGMNRCTVRDWLRAGTFPERAKRRSVSRIDALADMLKQRWEAGCQNAAQLTRELEEQGSRVSYFMVRRRIAKWRQENASSGSPRRQRQPIPCPSTRRVAWWLLRSDDELSSDDQRILDAVRLRCPELRIAAELARAFALMVRRRAVAAWKRWTKRIRAPGVPKELKRFVDGLEKDEAAVKAALSLEWSNGQLEGQINRLKTIKRQMYGRAGFDLLERRFLAAR
jgi:transposase